MTEDSAGTGLWPKVRHRLFHAYFLLRRPMTLGVRAVVHDRAERSVLLVRHTYVPGWQFPGGGVERGETFDQAMERELLEEAFIRTNTPAELRSLHLNRHASPRDHVAVYLVGDFVRLGAKAPDREIAESRFFRLDDLPQETTGGTRRRISEIFEGRPPSPYW